MRKCHFRLLINLILIVVVFSALFSGCGKSQEVSKYSIYYLNQEKTKTITQSFEPESDDIAAIIDEVIAKITDGNAPVNASTLYPEEVRILDSRLSDGVLTLNFSEEYLQIELANEVAARAALVHNFVQFDGIDEVQILVNGKPLTDSNGKVIGVLCLDDFIENPEKNIGDTQEARISLYFATLDGASLVKETRDVKYSANISVEKLVLQRLLEGPHTNYAKSAFNTNTEIVSVAVMDGVCFVNLSDEFLVQDFSIKEDVVIYSIVDTLTSLSNVDTVQISVNSNTNIVYRNKLSLSEYYSKNSDIIISEAAAREMIVSEENIEEVEEE